jgi:hypothetical protein
MSAFDHDFLMRQIRQLAQVVARLVFRAVEDGSCDAAVGEVRKAKAVAFGVEVGLLDRLEPASLALLVRDGESLRTLAWVTAQESDLRARMDRSAEAARLRARAIALYAECALRFPEEADACRAAGDALSAGSGEEPPTPSSSGS